MAVRLGLQSVRGLGADLAQAIEAGRPYASLEDLVRRVPALDLAQLEAMATAGAFEECFGLERREALWAVGAAAQSRPDRLEGIVVGAAGAAPAGHGPDGDRGRRPVGHRGGAERAPHPVPACRTAPGAGVVTSAGLWHCEPRSRVLVAGVVTHRQRPMTAQGTTFMNLEDETGLINIVVSKGCWARHRKVARGAPALLIRGRLERAEGVINIVAEELTPLPVPATLPAATSADEVGVLDKLVGSVHAERVRSGFVADSAVAGDRRPHLGVREPRRRCSLHGRQRRPDDHAQRRRQHRRRPRPVSIPATTTIDSTIPENPDLTTGTFQVPSGTLQVGVGDLYVVHDDGDLWLHPGLRDGASSTPVRLVDMDDPRVPVTEGEGPNTIEDVAGEVDGVVYFSDCCEPVAGDVRAATGPDTVEALGFGSSVALSPDRTQLATLNTFGLGVLNLTTGTSTFRSFDTGQPFINPWDVIWSADGRELVVLAFDENGGALHRFSASESLEAGDVIPIGVRIRPDAAPGGAVRRARTGR